MANFMIELENEIKTNVMENLDPTVDPGNALKVLIRDTTVDKIKNSEDIIPAGQQIPASIVRGAFSGVKNMKINTIQTINSLISGTIQGFVEAGGTQADAIKGSLDQLIKSANESELTISGVAVEAVKGSLDAVKELSGNSDEAKKDAILTVWDRAAEFGSDKRSEVKSSLINNIDGAEEFIK